MLNFGKIEQISEVGIFEKFDKIYVKDSVDRIISLLPEDDIEESLLFCYVK